MSSRGFAIAVVVVMAIASASCGSDNSTESAPTVSGKATGTPTPVGASGDTSSTPGRTQVEVPSATTLPTSAATYVPLPSGKDWATIDIGQFSDYGPPSPEVQLANDDVGWAELWSRHRFDSSSPPEVDFHSQSVVALFLGAGGGGDSVVITSVETSRDTAVVHAVKSVPASGCGVPAVITYPFHIVSFASKATRAELDLATRTTEC